MTSIEANPTASQPIDAVHERLNDPAVAASLVTLLDNTELLSTMVLGLSGLVGRGESLMDSFATEINDLKSSGASIRPEGTPSLAELGALTTQLAEAAPLLNDLLDSSIARPETIGVLSLLSDAATEGTRNAEAHPVDNRGYFALAKVLKDEDVQRGLNLFIEIARSLGRRIDGSRT